MLMRIAPVLFVLLWSTGFIGSRLGAPYAEPFTFLTLRFAVVLALLWPVAILTGTAARNWRERANSIVTGLMIHGGYLGGVFWSIRHGMPPGVSALIVSLQPILTGLLSAPLLGERLTSRHWLGLVLGLAGTILILEPGLTLTLGADSGITAATIGANVLALCAITAATLYQKRFSSATNLLAGTIWQYSGAILLVGAGSLLFETRDVHWAPEFFFALGWLVVVLSIGAVLLLMLLIRSSAVVSVSGLFYLQPAVVALVAWQMFGDTLVPLQLGGLALATVAVLLTSGGLVRSRRQ